MKPNVPKVSRLIFENTKNERVTSYSPKIEKNEPTQLRDHHTYKRQQQRKGKAIKSMLVPKINVRNGKGNIQNEYMLRILLWEGWQVYSEKQLKKELGITSPNAPIILVRSLPVNSRFQFSVVNTTVLSNFISHRPPYHHSVSRLLAF